MNCFLCVFFFSPALISKVCPPRIDISLKALKPCFIACSQVHGETCLESYKDSNFKIPLLLANDYIQTQILRAYDQIPIMMQVLFIHASMIDYYNFRLIGHIHPCA
jgi:hypothetical protein